MWFYRVKRIVWDNFVRSEGAPSSFCEGCSVQVEFLDLRGDEFVFITFLLRINYLLLFDPLTLVLLIAFSLLFDSHQSLRLEIVFFRSKELWLHYCLSLILRFHLESFFGNCRFKHPLNNSIFRHISECFAQDIIFHNSPFLLWMIIGTRPFLASFCLAFDSFIVTRVIVLFFPSVAHIAVNTHLASAIVIWYRDVVFGFPVEARLY